MAEKYVQDGPVSKNYGAGGVDIGRFEDPGDLLAALQASYDRVDRVSARAVEERLGPAMAVHAKPSET